ncbi:MAG: hypothetical protein E6G05_03770, partial [Actinobacteria bacterium]
MPARARLATAIGVGGSVLCVAWAAASESPGSFASPLAGALAIAGLVANVVSAEWDEQYSVGGSFVASMLAVAFIGPGPAFAVAAVAEIGAWIVQRYRLRVLPINVLSSGGANLAAGEVFLLIGARDAGRPTFFLALAAVASLALLVNALVVTTLISGLHGGRLVPHLRGFQDLAVPMAITVLMTVGVAAVYRATGLGGALLVLSGILAYTYMARLVITARERTRQYAA